LPSDPYFYFEIYTGKISWRETRKKFKTHFPHPLFDIKKKSMITPGVSNHENEFCRKQFHLKHQLLKLLMITKSQVIEF
jgi:hypothetical protein